MKLASRTVLAVAVAGSLGLAAWASGIRHDEPVNETCPVSGKDIKPNKASDVKVSFCCENCMDKFEGDPVPLLRKIDKLPNVKCPITGKAVVPKASATVKVGFCCDDCKGKFDKDPASFLGKLKAPDKK